MAEQLLVRSGQYADSVALMQVSRTVGGLPGVQDALVAMATALNLELLAGMGFTPPAAGSANDLLIAVRAADEAALAAAVEQAGRLLDAPATGGEQAGPDRQPPRTVGAAAAAGEADLAVISVPGQHAFVEAMDALTAGCHVLLFSDNVPLAQEIALKDAAAERGLLVMGPDCGTAVVGGIGLGFAHTVAAGPVGLVAASGTGAQQVLCLLDAAGVGVSAALGVGGRDLSERVAGRSARTALAMLDADDATELVLVISKPPAPTVAKELRELAGSLATPTRFALLGQGQPDLTQAVEQALGALGRPVPEWPAWRHETSASAGALRGLFCGGTLCDEAMLIASDALGEILSNIPLRPEWELPDPLGRSGPRSAESQRSGEPQGTGTPGHWMVDFGDDALTQGRPHPMIDPTLRDQRLTEVLADPDTGAVLLDVVLGHGAHPDPAAGLLPIIDGARVPVVISLIGAQRDPQDRDGTARRLHAAGASVFLSNAAATRHAVSLVREGAGRPEAGQPEGADR